MDQLLTGDGLSPNDIRRFLTRIAAIAVNSAMDSSAIDDSGAAIDTITALEELKAAAAGAQAVLTARVADTIRGQRRDAGIPAARWNTGIATQIGLARRDSPHRGTTHLGLARVLTTEMPHTLGQLRRGELSEWRATLLVRETACLSAEDRRLVDERLCADPPPSPGKATAPSSPWPPGWPPNSTPPPWSAAKPAAPGTAASPSAPPRTSWPTSAPCCRWTAPCASGPPCAATPTPSSPPAPPTAAPATRSWPTCSSNAPPASTM